MRSVRFPDVRFPDVRFPDVRFPESVSRIGTLDEFLHHHDGSGICHKKVKIRMGLFVRAEVAHSGPSQGSERLSVWSV